VIRALAEGGDDLCHDRLRSRSSEGDDLTARLELAEKKDVVDQLARLLDLLPGLVHELADVGAG